MDFVITGTHAYGPVTKDSDLDIVVGEEDALEIVDFLDEHNIEIYATDKQRTYDKGGFYFKLAGIEVNIIIASTEDDHSDEYGNLRTIDWWREQTDRMKHMEPVADRDARHSEFSAGYYDTPF